MTLEPATEALAFRIWAFAKPDGWNYTAAQIAEALNESTARVSTAISLKGWQHRIRQKPQPYLADNRYEVDGLEGLIN